MFINAKIIKKTNNSSNKEQIDKALISRVEYDKLKNTLEYGRLGTELNFEIDKEFADLMKEESANTFGRRELLSAVEYTTEEIERVRNHLTEFAKNSEKTADSLAFAEVITAIAS